MVRISRKSFRPLVALLLGLSATVLVAWGYRSGWGQSIELLGLDARFRYLANAPRYVGQLEPRPSGDMSHTLAFVRRPAKAGQTPPTSRPVEAESSTQPDASQPQSSTPPARGITQIDIDDDTLARVGALPWPRTRLADLIDQLDALDARAIALDIAMPEPQAPQYETDGLADLYSRSSTAAADDDAPPRPIYTDEVLARSLARSFNTYVPFQVEYPRPPAPLAEEIARALTTRPTLSAEMIAVETGLPVTELAEQIGPTRAAMLSDRVARALAQSPQASLADVEKVVLGTASRTGEQLAIIRQAYLRSRAQAAMADKALEGSAPGVAQPGQAIPPMVLFAQSMRRTGFIDDIAMPDQRSADGVLRSVSPLVRTPAGLYWQLAFSMAVDELARVHGTPAEFSTQPGALTLTFADGHVRRIDLDEGRMIIDWPRASARGDRVSAWTLLDLADQRHAMDRNVLRGRSVMAQVARTLQYAPMLQLLKDIDGLNGQLARARQDRPWTGLFDPAHVWTAPAELAEQLDGKLAELDRLAQTVQSEVRQMGWDKPPPTPAVPEPQDDPPPASTMPATAPTPWEMWAGYRKELARSQELAAGLRQMDQLRLANRSLDRAIISAEASLRPHVAGRLCLVGSTASGSTDVLATPMNPRTPGVMVEAATLNALLTGSFIRKADPAMNLMTILLCGAIVSLLSAFRPARQSLLLTILALTAFVAVNAMIVFRQQHIWLTLVAPLSAMGLSFGVVTSYRQLTEDRRKRQIRRLFSHAMSPGGLDRLAEDPGILHLAGERRRVSCFFSNLADFTALSESIGELETVSLLNRYFDRMGQVIQARHEGYLSKFLGDGIFAIFGAPVVVPGHARLSLAAALDCQAELNTLNAELARDKHPAAGRLRIRIGISTGEVVLGNCGSTHRLDYTAIGDGVGLASSLEEGNKHFGTSILCDDATYQSGGSDVLARPIGMIALTGRDESVAAWQPLCRRNDADGPLFQGVEWFAKALECFVAGDFRSAIKQFEAASQRFQESRFFDNQPDKVGRVFIDRCREYIIEPPESDFDGVLRLAEK